MCACPCVCVCPESVAESFFDTAFTDKCVKGDTPTVRLHGAELEHPAHHTWTLAAAAESDPDWRARRHHLLLLSTVLAGIFTLGPLHRVEAPSATLKSSSILSSPSCQLP